MKKLIISGLLLALVISTGYAQYRTERTGYEGDYFSLEGALDLFKQSSTLRDFERQLNTEENWVNNLDLNYDGRIDYIRVEHRRQGNFHAIILQALVDRYDIQDVAVIEIEIIRRGEALLQIIGDEDLYGEEVIVEPVEGYSDSRRGYHSDYGNFVNVYYWRPVQYIMGRRYQVYVSPYRWRYYPRWWNPWVQVSWNIFRPRIVVYVNRYHIVRRHRVIRVHNFYRPYRSYCSTVVQRANRVRVRHGRAPIHRPAPPRRQGRRDVSYQNRNSISERPGRTSRTNTTRRNEALSRNRTLPSSRPDAGRSRNQSSDARSRSSVDRSEKQRSTIRSSTPRQHPGVSRNRTTPSSRTDVNRSRNQRSDTRSRTSVDRTEKQRSTIRSSTPRQHSNVNRSRTTPSSRTDVNRSRNQGSDTRSRTSVDRTKKQRSTIRSSTPRQHSNVGRSRTKSSSRSDVNRRTAPRVKQSSGRSQTSKRQKSNVRKPAVNRKSSVPTAKPKVNRNSGAKRSSSRSRRGGGEL